MIQYFISCQLMPAGVARLRLHLYLRGECSHEGGEFVELRHLRYFIAVAEESTMVAAARRLRIAQPALTRQIHDLEKEIGVELFVRGARGMEMTPAGEVCLVSARHILGRVDAAIMLALGSSRGVAGRCVICCGTRGLSSGLLARIVARVHVEYPEIELVVIEGMGRRQWTALQTLEADIGIGIPTAPEYPDIVSETFDHDIFDSILISRAHALASRERVGLFDLADETFLSWTPKLAPEFARQLRAEFSRVKFKPAARRDFDEVYSLATLVSAGQGWTLFPSGTSALASADTVIIPLSDFKVPISHAILWRRTEQQPVVRTVLDVIRRLTAEERTASGRAPLSAVPPPAVAAVQTTHNARVERAIELRHLRYYSAVVEARSFGRAAERLELTQPALSRQIRDLERAVGVKLLERAARGATATPAGESFYKSARRILDEAAALPAEAHRARRGMLSRCVIASVSTSNAQRLLRELLRRCATELPALELTALEVTTPKQAAELRAARVDLGLCHATPMWSEDERGLRRERLIDDEMSCALVASESPLASRKSIEIRELADLPFLFPSRAFQPALYDQLFATFDEMSFRPRVDQTYEGLKTIWTLIAEGRGWGIGFRSQCDDPPPGTVSIPVDGFHMPFGIDVLSRADESRTMILLVIEMLHDVARTHETAP